MEHAWLDSLSEDWVSQTGPNTPASPMSVRRQEPSPSPRSSSRIPRWRHPGIPSLPSLIPSPSPNSKSITILSERSPSNSNSARRQLSRPSYRKALRSAIPNRSVSAGTSSSSVVHNTVQQRTSPNEGEAETPEWKRRLVYGDVGYGGQRDLFSSAAVGLQDIFKPPQPGKETRGFGDFSELHETTMPSSPPLYDIAPVDLEIEDHLNLEDEEEEGTDGPEQVTPSPSPRRPQREVKYKLNVDGSINSSAIRITTTSVRQQSNNSYQDQRCLSVPSKANTPSRKFSGHGDTRNEDFSSILIGKYSNEDGKVNFAPLEIPADQLRQRLERLRINQMILDPQLNPQACFDNVDNEASLNIETTDDYARNGGFINLRRGGRSSEGSFRHRGLSPDLGVDSSGMLPEESMQASTPKQFLTITTERTNPHQAYNNLKSPAMPRAPFPSPEKQNNRDAASGQSSGSPLKLFGPYDTFTNQTLLRRISQFEEGMSGRTSRQSSVPTTHGELNRLISQESPSILGSRAVSHFGIGEIEGYEFTAVSHASVDDSAFSGKKNTSPPSAGFLPIKFSCVSSPDEGSELQVRRSRNKPHTRPGTEEVGAGTMFIEANLPDIPLKGAPYNARTPKRDSGSDKRPRTSPSKDPTPKRRRTLHRSDIAFVNEVRLTAVDSAYQQVQHIIGKPLKDTLLDFVEMANPEVLARRSILRPRTPTPSQRSSQQREQQPLTETQPKKNQNFQGKRSPIKALQKENKPMVQAEAERKPSMQTQDFVDQAAQIMAMIRNQVIQPGLTSLEESEAEHIIVSHVDATDDFSEGSTAEPLSRPPSRDGKPVSRFLYRQEDPELVDRLKRYQELSDMGDIITSSVRSMGLAKHAIRAAQEVERMIEESSRFRTSGPFGTEGEVISDIPNVRISTNPEPIDEPASPVLDFLSSSSGRSTSQTYPTASSRSSESRRVIMPESVSHLIPDRIGGMFLDKQNNIWVKKKEMRRDSASVVAPSDTSEDDPFASIPDLTVDVTKELQQLKLNAGNREALRDDNPLNTIENPSQISSYKGRMNLPIDEKLDSGMSARAREEIEKLDPRIADFANLKDETKRGVHVPDDRTSNPTSTVRRRNLTISFSSPIASVIHDVSPEDLDSLEDDPDISEAIKSANVTPSGSPARTPTIQPALKNIGQMSMYRNRGTPGHGSVRGSAFVPRPVSRIDEQDEESTVELPILHQNDRQLSISGDNTLVSHKSPDDRSLGFIINQTPAHNSIAIKADDSLLIGRNIGRLSLSPLSEFTLHNADQSFGFEVSYVMGRRHIETGDGSKKVLSMTIRELVDKLSEVEPSESYWEDMAELDLHGKRLTSLHMLDEFCGRVITLDVSRNALGHLEGVPRCVRQLKVSNNMLTELTSWDHLMNLQYVDISGNEVKSLSALKNLVHLRSLRADNNQLTSLDGLDSHDGLLTLKARDNLIEELDFTEAQFERLIELDLRGNKVGSVRNLELLPALSRLDVSKNKLQTLTFSKANKTLRQLDVGDNELTFLDIRNLPNLHTLHADGNRIHDISGFRHARRMDSLSLREQKGKTRLNLSFLSSACEIRKLFLSGNFLGSFRPRADFLNLQLLELANCGLQELPEELGQLMPNLRTFNLNFNALPDLSPLRFIPRLKKLLIAGNRLTDSTSVTELLTEFPYLTQLDLRDNPITQGFYPPVQVLVTAKSVGCVDAFTLPDAEVERNAKFAQRLDEATRLRRRLHEVVFVASCKRLRKLDGLPIRRSKVLVRDALVQQLIDEGLVPDLEDTLVAELESPRRHKEAMTGTEAAAEHSSEELHSRRLNAEDGTGAARPKGQSTKSRRMLMCCLSV